MAERGSRAAACGLNVIERLFHERSFREGFARRWEPFVKNENALPAGGAVVQVVQALDGGGIAFF